MSLSTFLGMTCLIGLVAFILFALRQGMKVKKPPEGVPPNRYTGG